MLALAADLPISGFCPGFQCVGGGLSDLRINGKLQTINQASGSEWPTYNTIPPDLKKHQHS